MVPKNRGHSDELGRPLDLLEIDAPQLLRPAELLEE